MAAAKFVSYIRVSTQKQGASGLGLEAQQVAVAAYVVGDACELIAEFQEVETGKGADALAKRPQLRAALETCRLPDKGAVGPVVKRSSGCLFLRRHPMDQGGCQQPRRPEPDHRSPFWKAYNAGLVFVIY